MKFKIFYCILIVGTLLYPMLLLFGPVSLRHLLCLVMFVVLCTMGEVKFDKFIWSIFSFVFFLGISSFITGFGNMFLGKLFGTYFVGIVLYLSTRTMIKKYDALLWIYVVFVSLSLLDAVVTIGQFFNNPLAVRIADFLGVKEYQEDMWASIDAHSGAIGGIGAGGLFGVVKNGIFLCAASIFSLYNKNGIKWWNWGICFFLLIALFFVQERTGLLMGIIGVFAYLFLNSRKSLSGFISLVVVILLSFYIVPQFFLNSINFEETRYGIQMFTGLEDRGSLSDQAFNYISLNPMGGAYDYIARGNSEPHNLIANCYIYGGIFGGSIILIVIIVQMIIVFKIMKAFYQGKNIPIVLVNVALIYFCLTANSLTHNNSLPRGDEYFYLFWGLLSILYYKNSTSFGLSIKKMFRK